jgi:hypothetical protein
MSQDGQSVDSIMIVKDRHGPGLYDCHKSAAGPKPMLERIVKSRRKSSAVNSGRPLQKL